MKSFKVGDRVRIVCPTSNRNGCAGTIYHMGVWFNWHKESQRNNGVMGYAVDIDGFGKTHDDDLGSFYAFIGEELRPIVNPDETAWTEFKRYLQPDPAVILAKEPA